MYDHLQAQALDPADTLDFIAEVTKAYIDAARPR
jgi:hypothetical protein